MDKTIELIVAFSVIMTVGLILVIMTQGQSQTFTDFLNTNSQNADCQIAKTRYQNACICEKPIDYSQAQPIENNNPQCDWSNTDCTNVCN